MSNSKSKNQNTNDPFSLDYLLNKLREGNEQASNKRMFEILKFWFDYLELNKKATWQNIQDYHKVLGISTELQLTKYAFDLIKFAIKKLEESNKL